MECLSHSSAHDVADLMEAMHFRISTNNSVSVIWFIIVSLYLLISKYYSDGIIIPLLVSVVPPLGQFDEDTVNHLILSSWINYVSHEHLSENDMIQEKLKFLFKFGKV